MCSGYLPKFWAKVKTPGTTDTRDILTAKWGMAVAGRWQRNWEDLYQPRVRWHMVQGVLYSVVCLGRVGDEVIASF